MPFGLHPPDTQTLLQALALITLAGLVIRLGRTLLLAVIFGLVSGVASYYRGGIPEVALAHAAIGTIVALIVFGLLKLTKNYLWWVLIIGFGVIALLGYAMWRHG
jgi:hypothetical protein